MKPVPLDGLLGERRAATRSKVNDIISSLVADEMYSTRVEAIRMIKEELLCLEAEERGLNLILRGWGETMDLGLLAKRAEKQLSGWAKSLASILHITSASRVEQATEFSQFINMSLAYKVRDANEVITITTLHQNRDLTPYEEHSLDGIDESRNNDHDHNDGNDEENDEDGMEEADEGRPVVRQRTGILREIMDEIGGPPVGNDHGMFGNPADWLRGNDGEEEQERNDDEEDEEDEEEDDDDEDEDEEDEDGENQEKEKTRVDFVMRASQSGVSGGIAEEIILLSFTTCTNHSWEPILYEDDEDDEKAEHKRGSDEPDYYHNFERTGTRGAYSMISKTLEYMQMKDNMLLWALEGRPPRKPIRKTPEAFLVEDECECNVCGTVHGFRIEVNWKALFALTSKIQSVIGEEDIAPKVLYRFDCRVDDPSDELFAFVRAVRVLAFFLVYCGGSSGYSISPVDMLMGTLISSGLPVFSGTRVNEFFADYDSDGSLGVD